MQRFVWDLMYPNPPSDGYDLPISAIYKDTPFVPQGPAVLPGVYWAKLTANGRTLSQKFTVRMDPRVRTSPLGLTQQFTLSMQAYEGVKRATTLLADASKLSADMAKARVDAKTDAERARIDAAIQKIKALTEGSGGRRGGAAVAGAPVAVTDLPLSRLAGAFTSLLDLLQDADVAPSTQAVAAARDLQTALAKAEKALADAIAPGRK